MAELLTQNCQLTERMLAVGNQSKGMRWQVPWGKHYPAYRRGSHSTRTDKNIPIESSLPIVVIRDPYSWAQSMCRHTYTANWSHTDGHCPNLIPSDADLEEFPDLSPNELIHVKVRYAKDFHEYHDSLFDMWNDWYGLYVNASYPRLIVRFEEYVPLTVLCTAPFVCFQLTPETSMQFAVSSQRSDRNRLCLWRRRPPRRPTRVSTHWRFGQARNASTRKSQDQSLGSPHQVWFRHAPSRFHDQSGSTGSRRHFGCPNDENL